MSRALDTSITARLHHVARRLRRYLLIEGLAFVVGFLLLAAAIQLALDYTTRGLRWSMRATLLGLMLAGALWLVWRRVVGPLRLRFGLADVANLVERRYPAISSTLISAVRFATGEVGPPTINSPDLVASVIAQAGEQVRSFDFDAVLNPLRARRAGIVLLMVFVVCTCATAASPQTVGLWFHRNILLQNIDWPKRTHLVVDMEGDVLIGARGDDLIVQAHAIGVQPREVEIVFETASGQRGREVMVTVGNPDAYRYRYLVKNPQEDFVFHLKGGDDTTETFQAKLLERPRVAGTEIRCRSDSWSQCSAPVRGPAA